MCTVLCKLCNRQTTCDQAYGTIWAFFLVCGLLATTTNGVVNLIQYHTQKEEDEAEWIVLITLVPLLGYLLLMFMLTVLGLDNLA